MREIAAVLLVAACLLAGCSSSQPSTFAVTGASVDPTYWCPGGANNTPYDLHATLDVSNGTKSTVTIKSMTAELQLVAVQGSWLEKVGDRYDAGNATYSPGTLAPSSSGKVLVTIASACTSNRYEFGGSSRGEYSVTVHLVTSAGAFSVTAQNHHEILAA